LQSVSFAASLQKNKIRIGTIYIHTGCIDDLEEVLSFNADEDIENTIDTI